MTSFDIMTQAKVEELICFREMGENWIIFIMKQIHDAHDVNHANEADSYPRVTKRKKEMFVVYCEMIQHLA